MVLADTLDAGTHLLHLLLGVGVGILKFFRSSRKRRIFWSRPSVRLLIRLPTWRWIISPFLSSSRRGLGELAGLLEDAEGVLDGGDGLLLHGQDALGLLADRPALVVELAGDVLVGDDPEAELAALAQVGALEVVEVAGVGVEGDDRAGGELERGEVPGVADLLVLDGGRRADSPWESQSGRATSRVGSEPPVATLYRSRADWMP